ncbi:hypothetical protein ACFO5K_09735 [Nocardia halotolerans]|uniref:Cell division protein FtsL n=1 Tax=Nocardia halotolerans TaxID=1755878 RepID=A0ABV8VEF6_9NOCA
MSVRTSTVAVPGRTARRVQAAERVKSGAAQRAYARKRTREQLLDGIELPQPSSTMAGRIPFVAAIIGLLGCGLALTLLLTTRAAEDSYLLGDARAVNRTLADERAALQREVAAADSAPELAARARELGMIPATDPARLVLGPDGAVTVIGTPTPAQGAPAPPLNGSPTPTPEPGAPGQGQGERVVPVRPGAAAADPAAPAGDEPNVLAAPNDRPGTPEANPPQGSPQPAPADPAQAEPVPAAPVTVPDRIDISASPQGNPFAPAETPLPGPDVEPAPAGPPSETPQIVAPEGGR